jgi:hypothetical protein
MIYPRKTKYVPMDVYPTPPDFNPGAALAFTRESAPGAWVAVMLEIQDRIADATDLVAAMQTSKEHGYLARCAGELGALVELYNSLEGKRAEAVTERL